MKFHLIAAAAALTAAFGSAHALTPQQISDARTAGTLKEIYVSGASAQRLTFGAFVEELCTLDSTGAPGHNDLDIYFDGVTGTTGNNSRAYACTLSQAVGTTFPVNTPIVIYKRDQSGSVAGIGPVNDRIAQSRLQIDSGCARVGANPSPVVDFQKQSYNCANANTSAIPDIGLADVEPARFADAANLSTGMTPPNTGNLTRAALMQGIFGVIVNPTLYKALQAEQGLSQVDVPADQSAWTAGDIANIPSLPSTFVASLFTGKLVGGNGNATAKKGWNIVLPSDSSATTKTINILRRTEGSGTQASSALFLNNGVGLLGCTNTVTNNTPAACQSAAITATGVNTVIQEYTGSGALETGFQDAETAGAYAIGTLGRENNPRANAGASAFDGKAYRFVKLDGIAPLRSAAQVGDYKFVYEASAVYNSAFNASGSDVQVFFAALTGSNGMGKASTLARADVDTQQGAMSLPTYSGAFENLTGTAKSFSSAVQRTSGNSNTPLLRQK